MRRLLVPFAAVALLAAGCGSSGSGDTGASSAASTPSTSSTTASTGSSGGGVAIGMKGLQFDPKAVTVKVGQKVTWTDLEDIPHNVTAESGGDFRSSTFGKGKTFSFTPKKAGTIKYVCTIHPGMEGTLTVSG
jgi:plastocyanin